MAKESSLQTFPIDFLLEKLIMLWRWYINVTSCKGLTGYWSETIVPLKENIVFAKFFEHLLVVT